MNKYLVNLSYDGYDYYGWCKQNNLKTIQGTIENTIRDIFNIKSDIIGASKTDKKVHALQQFFIWETEFIIDVKKLKWILNNKLPASIRINDIKICNDNFVIRKPLYKKYKYFINDNKIASPFLSRYEHQIKYKVDVKKLQKILNLFIGTHDFFNFSAIKNEETNHIKTERNISKIKIYRNNKQRVVIEITGQSFIRHQIRCILGNSLAVFKGKLTIEDIKNALNSREYYKTRINKVPGQGLLLAEICY